TAIFGVLAIVMAVQYARNPDRRRLSLVAVLSIMTLGAGLLGTVTGIMTSIRYAEGLPNQGSLVLMGTFESLYDIWLGLILFRIGGLVTAVGAWRSGRASGQAEPAVEQAREAA